jgi:glycosyltransferase A (GT-A) superfamily protein (DUF2064 family)
MSAARALVVAKAPVPGLAKTRLGARIGYDAAADLAAAALLDTLDAASSAFAECHLALAGDLGDASRSIEIRAALRSWHVFGQEGVTLGDRLAHAHRTVAAFRAGAVVQVGMDTPQVTASMLTGAADLLRAGGGVLGPAEDGGWWLLALSDPVAADVLADVTMSSARTRADTRRALAGRGVFVANTRTLRDVDTVDDARLVARAAPGTRFAEAWSALGVEVA